MDGETPELGCESPSLQSDNKRHSLVLAGLQTALNGLVIPPAPATTTEDVTDIDTPSSNESDFKIEETLSQETTEKIETILQNSILQHVKCLGDHTVNSYCDLIEKHYPINEDDWKELKKQIQDKASHGSHVQIKIIHGSLPSVKKNDNIKVRVFITHPQVSPEPLSQILEGDVADENNFEIDGIIQVPNFDDCVIRIEILKVKSDGIVNGRKVVGINEIPLTTIPTENAFENLYVLSRPEAGIFSMKDDPGRLRLRLQKILQAEHDPNKTVPNILSDYFYNKFCEYLNIIEPKQNPKTPTAIVKYKLEVEQKSDMKIDLFHAFQYKDREPTCGNENVSSFPVDCILSNSLVLGAAKTRKTSRAMLFVPTTKSPSVSPSRTSSMLSIPDGASPISQANRKLSPAQGEKQKSVMGLLTTLSELTTVREYCELSRDLFWDLEIRVETDSLDFPLNKEEFTLIYSKALSHFVESMDNPQGWNGKLPDTLTTIMKLLVSCSDISRGEMQCCVGQAFIETFLKVDYHDRLLFEHLDNLAEAHTEEDAPACLREFTRRCLSYLEIHLLDLENERLYAVIQNLKMLLRHNHLPSSALEEALKSRHKLVFEAKVSSKEKELKKNNPDKPLNNLQLCDEVLNLIIIELHHFPLLDHQSLFDGVLDFQLLRSKTYLSLCAELLRSSLPENIKIPYKAYSEQDPRVIDLTLSLGCFRAVKRLSETIYPREKLPCWVFEVFKMYPKLWIHHLIIGKTESYLENILKYVREKNIEEPLSVTKDRGNISRSQSYEDIILTTLTTFSDISTGCWKDWKDITGCWPQRTIMVETGLQMIKSLAQLEKRLLDQFGRIHLLDGELSAKELCETIKLLEGLLKNHKTYHKQIHEEVADGGEIIEEELEALGDRMKEVVILLGNIKTDFKTEIDHQIKDYCSSQREKVRNFIINKKLTEESIIESLQDSKRKKSKELIEKFLFQKENAIKTESQQTLMNFLDNECRIVYRYYDDDDVNRENTTEILLALWEMVETEISKKFDEKKERNKEKNKPSRFNYFKLSLPVMQEAKQIFFNNFDISDVKTDTYQKILDELRLLAEDSRVLVNAVLRMKAERTELMTDSADSESRPVLSLKLAHIGQENSAIVEILSLSKIPPREGRSATNIQLCLRFSPNSLGTGQICERTEVFKDINEAIIFNISGDDSTGNPQVFVFNLSHMSSNFKEWEDGFIIIDLFSVSKISPRQCLGEVVIQVMKNGILCTEIQSVPSREEWGGACGVPALSFSMQGYPGVFTSPEYRELAERQDSLARAAVDSDKELMAGTSKDRSRISMIFA